MEKFSPFAMLMKERLRNSIESSSYIFLKLGNGRVWGGGLKKGVRNKEFEGTKEKYFIHSSYGLSSFFSRSPCRKPLLLHLCGEVNQVYQV